MDTLRPVLANGIRDADFADVADCSSCSQKPSAIGTLLSSCRVMRDFTLLHEVSSTLAQGLELSDAVQPMFTKLTDAGGLRRGMLTIINRETGDLTLEESEESIADASHQVLGKVGDGLLGRVAATGETTIVSDLSASTVPLTELEARLLRGAVEQKESLIAVPIRQGHEILGTLSFTRPAATAPALDTDARFLTLVAGQVGLAVRFRQISKERLDTLRQENARLQEQIKSSLLPEGMIGHSSAMRMVYFHVDQVASSKTTVLIRGETGSGKERIAQAIWQAGPRKTKPFVRVNCAALPESIIESELFGHEKGAFTGALSLRKGRFELAHTGTLFLDEIGEISAATQAKLLRVLQEGAFERVGGTQTIKVDVRVIAATNRNLEEMIDSGKWRLDLYYRLNVFPVYVPPLRERRSDILELADYFLEKYSRENGKKVARISTPAIDMLMAYHWPGNVRELENIIERAVILATDGVIHGYHLPPTLQTGEASNTSPQRTLKDTLDAVEKEMIIEALKAHRGIMAKAARQLGLTERIMGLRVKAHDIDARRFREAD